MQRKLLAWGSALSKHLISIVTFTLVLIFISLLHNKCSPRCPTSYQIDTLAPVFCHTLMMDRPEQEEAGLIQLTVSLLR